MNNHLNYNCYSSYLKFILFTNFLLFILFALNIQLYDCQLFNGLNSIGDCDCNNHSNECRFESFYVKNIESASLDKVDYRQESVCVNCDHHTIGKKCEHCIDGFYRPLGTFPNSSDSCRPCECTGPGTTGHCVKDDSLVSEGLKPGSCFCKRGFEGFKCERCSQGYFNFPNCELCYCSLAGIVDPFTCDPPCKCKSNVEGPRCDSCKSGFYDLSQDNPNGCSACFCFGVTQECDSLDYGVSIISSKGILDKWLVTNLKGDLEFTIQKSKDHIVIPADDIYNNNMYYWLAPDNFLGDMLTTFGGYLKLNIASIVLRGDSSGRLIKEVDLILEGGPNNTKIGLELNPIFFKNLELMRIKIKLIESNWFLIDSKAKKKRPVTRSEFAYILSNLKRFLIRAKYHTGQIEGILYLVTIEKGSEVSKSKKKQTGAEKCLCPEGYPLPSCGPGCEFGYRMVNNSCIKCECNNHSETCNSVTGECTQCLHNTEGPNCNRCKKGFYGDPLQGNYNDCKPCACPLIIPSQNYSPSCITIDSGQDYICTECNYQLTGNKCERCKPGWFGNPSILGEECTECECSSNVDMSQPDYCDSLTGQCKCIGNVTGWKCDECLENFWGNVSLNMCQPCDCFLNGSLSLDCDKLTGQCKCKPNYIGIKCDTCAFGHSNLELDCPACKCDKIGSELSICDPDTGQCFCKKGVSGDECDHCSIGYFDFSQEGCSFCNCHEIGSLNQSCEQITGKCNCKPFVAGIDCGRCEKGYWNLNSNQGCKPCNCNVFGSISDECDQFSGQCECKIGVNGKSCDICKFGYVGSPETGCKMCEMCQNPNQICNKVSGKCECPFNKTGQACTECPVGTHEFGLYKQCKACECNSFGSLNNECDQMSGQCKCLNTFEGKNCDRCKFGFYGFPDCKPCKCDPMGTISQTCYDNDICQCDQTGQCSCKANTMGKKCNQCKEHTFSMFPLNPLGCFSCFCFERSKKCEQANYFLQNYQYPSQQVYFAKNEKEQVYLWHEFNVIPFSNQSRILKKNETNNQAIYWELPQVYSTDKTNSYNGYLRFHLSARYSTPNNPILLNKFPLIVLHGNRRVTLYHFSNSLLPSNSFFNYSFNIHLHESQWVTPDNLNFSVSRKHFMIALQKVEKILIRSSIGANLEYSQLTNVALSVALKSDTLISSNLLAIGIEKCECPPQFSGLSCQNSNVGFYRKTKPSCLNSPNLIDVIGTSEPCFCNNHSLSCDSETGECLNCSHNTAGPNCDRCAFGYYGNPLKNITCVGCKCPIKGHSFTNKCEIVSEEIHLCFDCEKGYTGLRCEICDDGYFGNPKNLEFCKPCNCNLNGSLDFKCDKISGQCHCKKGFHGKNCNLCLPKYISSQDGCQNCDNYCINELQETVIHLADYLKNWDYNKLQNLPFIRLNYVLKKISSYQSRVTTYHNLINQLTKMLKNTIQNFDMHTLINQIIVHFDNLSSKSFYVRNQSALIHSKVTRELILYNNYQQDILRIIDILKQCVTNSILAKDKTFKIIIKAEQVLTHLQNIDFLKTLKASKLEQIESKQDYNQIINLLSLFSSFKPNLNLSQLTSFLNLAQITINTLQNQLQATLFQSQVNRHQIVNLNHILNKFEIISKLKQENFKKAASKVFQSQEKLVDAFANQDNITLLIEDENFKNLSHLIEEKHQLYSKINLNSKHLLIEPCQKHILNLNQTLFNLDQIIRPSLTLSEKAIKVKTNLEKIQVLINETVFDLETVNKINLERSEIKFSTKVKDQRHNLSSIDDKVQKVNAVEEHCTRINKTLSKFEQTINDQSQKLKSIQNVVQGFKKKFNFLTRSIYDTISYANRFYEGLKKNEEDLTISHLIEEIDIGLKPKLKKIKSKDRLKDISDIVNNTIVILKAYDNKRKNYKSKDISHLHQQVVSEIRSLKNHILLARQKASEIQIALTTDLNKKCVRSYYLETEPSTFNSISMTYTTKDKSQDSLLFFLSNPENLHFLAVEMVNQNIRFLWNLNSSTNILQHPLKIKTNDELLADDNRWYLIKIYRIGNYANLSVQNIPEYNKKDPFFVNNSSSDKNLIINLKSGNNLFIGGVPEKRLFPKELKSKSFSGCLFDLYFDDKYIGLWNFWSNVGCQACTEAAPFSSEGVYQFDGNSYSKLEQIQRYDKQKYDVALAFKSLDENALIFFAPNLQMNHSLAIFCLNGKIIYHLNFGLGQLLELESSKKYNHNKWVKLSAGLEINNGKVIAILKVNDEEIIKKRNQSWNELDLKVSFLFFGGISPDFNTSFWPLIIYKKFLGCLRDVQIDSTPLDLMANDYFGLNEGCKNRFWQSVRFNGKGSLELESQPLKDFQTFSFMFKTKQNRSLLYLSMFKNKSSYYHFSLMDGYLKVRINVGQGDTILTSNLKVNDGQFHTIEVVKQNQIISMKLDDGDTVMGHLKVKNNNSIDLVTGRTFFGGTPKNQKLPSRLVTEKFIGIIKNFIFNGHLIKFNEAINFEKVEIGRDF